VDETGVIRRVWAYETDGVPDIDDLLAGCRGLRPSGESG
jgi:hypothetical protein